MTAAFSASPRRVLAQAAEYAPAAQYAQAAPHTRTAALADDLPPKTRSNRVHILGLVLGGAGVMGGLVMLLGGAFFGGLCGAFSSGGCDRTVFTAGTLIAPLGAVAMIASWLALRFDRVALEPQLRASASPRGAMLALDLAF